MTVRTPREFIPIALVFSPTWWYHNYGLTFDRSFYFDRRRRIQDDVLMRRALYDRYGWMGLGEQDPRPRGIIGSMHVAGGFMIPAMFGAQVHFSDDQAPWVLPMNLSDQEVWQQEVPEITVTPPLSELIADMDELEAEYGHVMGDFDIDGVLNTALCLRGQQLFIDLLENPRLVTHLLRVIAQTQSNVARYMLRRTKSCSIATNRMVSRVEPSLFLHSNCAVKMVSPTTYQEALLPFELSLAALQPYGIHHCGDNMHVYAPAYSSVAASFYDVGWGSDVKACREVIPTAFFSLRLSPVRMLHCQASEIAADTDGLLSAAGPLDQVGICCMNMDCDTPDDNIIAMFEVVDRYRRHGG